MSERNGYAPGVPCWVDTWQADVPGFVGGEPAQPVSRDVVAGMAAVNDPQGAVFSISEVPGASSP